VNTPVLPLLAAAALFLSACASGPVPGPAAKAELAPTGVLRVAVFTGNPVIGSKDAASGEVTGTTAILGEQMARAADLPLKVIEYTAVARLVEDARAGTWDVAVVDLFLKEGSGLGVLRGCEQRAPHQLVVILSNYATREMRAQCLALGADAVFDKSTELDNFLHFVQRIPGQADRS